MLFHQLLGKRAPREMGSQSDTRDLRMGTFSRRGERQSEGDRQVRNRVVPAIACMAILLLGASVQAQCVGDCDSNGSVSMTELVTATRLGLGQSASCAAADRDGNGVTIDEIVAAVNSATGGCTAVMTATPTPSATPTRTLNQATLTPTAPVTGCGNGSVDFPAGETCDDGNTVEGDSCPANCRIATCVLSGESVDVDVNFTVPAGNEILGIETFLRYPDGVVGIPGRLGAAQVFDRISDAPDNVVLQPNDLDYGLIMVAFSFDSSVIAQGRLYSVRFDRCVDARAPLASDFQCTVNAAGDANGVDVSGVTCAATPR